MKIIGFIYHNNRAEMVLKGDSSMLNGKKPFFIPDGTNDIRMTPCIILRVSRLGKNISESFADRYYDAVAPGADFIAEDLLEQAENQGHSWTSAIAFDFSLAMGEWCPVGTQMQWYVESVEGTQSLPDSSWLMTPEQAVHEISRLMTIRQGDLIYIQQSCEGRSMVRNEVIHATTSEGEKLYCKIK